MARLAYRYFASDSDHQVVAFTVDAAYREQDEFSGLPLIDFEDLGRLHPPGETALFVAIGYRNMNRIRAERFAAAKALGYSLPSYVSSRCTYLSEHPPGSNCLILEDNTIQTGVRIGDDVVLWSGNHVGHDAEVGDHCFVTSHVVISGFVKVGHHSFLGVNSTLRDSITIAPHTLVGAGAVILEDTVERGVYVPERSRRLAKTSDEVSI